jgi:hypothetical protein
VLEVVVRKGDKIGEGDTLVLLDCLVAGMHDVHPR